MSRVRKVGPEWTPDQPHPDERRNRFCEAMANGGTPSACYRAHIAKPGTSAASIKAAAWGVSAEPPVKARIEWLRRQIVDRQAVDESPLTSSELRALMEEVSAILAECHKVGRLSGVASAAQLTRIERATVVHIGRLSRSTTPNTKKATRTAYALDTDALPWCICGDTLD